MLLNCLQFDAVISCVNERIEMLIEFLEIIYQATQFEDTVSHLMAEVLNMRSPTALWTEHHRIGTKNKWFYTKYKIFIIVMILKLWVISMYELWLGIPLRYIRNELQILLTTLRPSGTFSTMEIWMWYASKTIS